MPFDGTLVGARYISGELFSVNKRTTASIKNLYCVNERVVLLFQNKTRYFSLIFVGACLVGGIAVILPSLQGDTRTHIPGLEWKTEFQPQLATSEISRGSEIGYFYFGSTVILLTSRDCPNWLPTLEKDNLVRVGDPLAGPAISR